MSEIITKPNETIVRQSADLWNGIVVSEQVLLPEMPIVNQKFSNHLRIVINIGRPITVEWKDVFGWKKKVYGIGCGGMVPPNHFNTTRWDKESKAMIIFMEKDFIEKQLEISNFELIPQRGICDAEVNCILYEFKKLVNNLAEASKMYGDMLALSLAIHIATRYAKSPGRILTPKGKLTPLQLKNVADYTYTLINHNLCLSELAKQVNVSPFHFARMFKKTTGIAPHQYILQLRIERAKFMLKHTNKSLTNIAYDLGFTDLSHFTSTFKRTTGLPAKFFRTNEPEI